MPETPHYRPRPNTYRLDNILIDQYANRIGPIGVAVYNAVARYADRDSGMCRLGITKISDKLNLSRTSVKKYLHILFREGLIAIIPQYMKQGGQAANHYLLLDITPEGRARRHAQLSALLRNTDTHAEPGGSPRDLPPSLNDHLATGGRSPNDPIQQSFSQDILPTGAQDDLPAIQRTCSHPAREVTRLFDGTTICHRCYKLLDTAASEPAVPAASPALPSDRAHHPQTRQGDGHVQQTALPSDIGSEVASESKNTVACGGRPCVNGTA